MNGKTQDSMGCGPGCARILPIFLAGILIYCGILLIGDGELGMGIWFLLIGILIPVITFIIRTTQKNEIARAEQERLDREAEIARVQKEQRKSAIAKCKEDEDKLINNYGNPNKIIRLEETDINRYFIVFGDSNALFVSGILLEFKNILSYNIIDDYSITKGSSVATTTTVTDVGEAISLGVAGSIIGGDAGAMIGSSMASKESTTIITNGEDKIKHNYTLNINVRDINNPLVKFKIGDNTDISMEINAIMLYIMENNK